MAGGGAPGVRGPDRRTLRGYLCYALSLLAVFLPVYGGSNWLAEWRGGVTSLYWSWELGLPFVPGLIVVYHSINLLFLTPLFWLPGPRMPRLAQRMLAALLISSVVFLIFPVELGFPRHQDAGPLQPVYDALYAVDRPYNLFPSLHIALSTLVTMAVGGEHPGRGRGLMLAWLIAICISVVLVHQHHVIDVIGGLALAWLCQRWLPEAWLDRLGRAFPCRRAG